MKSFTKGKQELQNSPKRFRMRTAPTMIEPVNPPQLPPVTPTPAAPAPTGALIQSKQIGKYKVDVIRDKCIGAASCVAIAPKVFQLDEENIAKILSQDGEDDDTKLLAAQSCPTAAIVVTDTTTGHQVWPPVV
jgi:ferredoxin